MVRADQALAFLGSTFVGVAAYFAGKAAGLEPPDLDPAILALVCAAGAVILGGLMFVLRRNWTISWAWIARATVALAVVGFIAAFFYFDQRQLRVGNLETGQPKNYVTVANRLTAEGLRDLKFNLSEPGTTIAHCEPELQLDISFACARSAAAEMGYRISNETFFDASALKTSRDVLSRLYFAMALCLILAMFLVVDEYIHTTRAKRDGGEEDPVGGGAAGAEGPAPPA